MKMNRNFKELLLQLEFTNVISGFRFHGLSRKSDYRKMILYGAFAEMGENYYLYIYRDFYNRAVHYGAILFLYHVFERKDPISFVYTDKHIDPGRRATFIKVAVYFLKHRCENTMKLTGKVKDLYKEIKGEIDNHNRAEAAYKKKIEDFDFDIINQEIGVKEIEPKLTAEDVNILPSPRHSLKFLQAASPPETAKPPHPKAKLAWSLVIPHQQNEPLYFEPLVVPIKRDGQPGVPKKAIPSQIEQCDLTGLPGPLREFLHHHMAIDGRRRKDPARREILSDIYSGKIAREIFTLADDLTFCQLNERPNQYIPLKLARLKKVSVRFAPSLYENSIFRIWLTGFTDSGDILEAADRYRVQVDDDQEFIFLRTPDGQPYFAAAENPEDLSRFFRFLNFQREFHLNDFEEVSAALKAVESDSLLVETQLLKKYRLTFLPVPILKILEANVFGGRGKRLEIEFDYDSVVQQFRRDNPDSQMHIYDYDRDRAFEEMCISFLKSDDMLDVGMEYDYWTRAVTHYFEFSGGDEYAWLVERGPRYLKKGFKIYHSRWKRFVGHSGGQLWIHIQSGIKWLEFKPLLRDGATGNDLEIQSVDFENRLVTDQEGMLHLVTPEDIRKLKRLTQYAEQRGHIFRIPSENYILINALYDQRMDDIPRLKEKLLQAKKLEQFKKIPGYKLSKHFNGELRPYQQAGFCWLHFLHDYGLAGCLADDMGLGKTVQTLALLHSLKEKKELTTCLLVVPVSAIPNWEVEIDKFTPGLTRRIHLGVNREKDSESWNKYDLLITSYATLRNDIELFSGYDFDYIVLDESQNIKNFSSQTAKAVKVLTARHRLALSGTPVENNSLELWSLFDFLIPGFLGTRQWFLHQFAVPLEKYKEKSRADMLRQMIFPFVLRRKKEQVETELPPKSEIVTKLKMEEEQLQLYAHLAAYYRDEIDREIDVKGVAQSSMKILEGMLRLRQLCLFPRLVRQEYEKTPSVKFDHFTGLMEDILAEGHKVLIFSQFVEVLKILRAYFEREQIRYSYIDGSVDVKKRQKMIQAFQQNKKIGAFLLSLKAGGVAINLTAADYVIIFDPWWNPAVEAQAIDRSHRIGQTKKVIVYRMVVEDSIEEKMLEMQNQKKELVDNLITADAKIFKNLSKEEIIQLFQ
jgi:superfamily II DNA or RNA helicase